MERIISFFTGNWKILLIAAAVLPMVFLLGQCDGRKSERARQAAARAEANVEALKVDQGARDAAAERRVIDATQVNQNEERLIDAIESTPDEAPDAVRVRLGCERLRTAGEDTAAIAACR